MLTKLQITNYIQLHLYNMTVYKCGIAYMTNSALHRLRCILNRISWANVAEGLISGQAIDEFRIIIGLPVFDRT